MKFFILLISINFVFAANLIKFDVIEKSDNFEIIFHLDKEFSGKIYQNSDQNLSLTIENLHTKRQYKQNTNLNFIENFSITPGKNSTKISFTNSQILDINASVLGKFLIILVKPKSKIDKNFSFLEIIFSIILIGIFVGIFKIIKELFFQKSQQISETKNSFEEKNKNFMQDYIEKASR